MANWWSELGMIRQIFYTIAIPATIILVIQSILSIIGLTDVNTDFDGLHDVGNVGFENTEIPHELNMNDASDHASAFGDFKFFTIRGIVAFFTIFGWTGAAQANSSNMILAVFISIICGILAMVLVGYMFYLMTKLQSNGNIQYANCLGKTGEVYLTIPPTRQGKGKVTITVQERYIEVEALTDEEQPIKSGSSIKVTGMLSDHTVIVEKA